MNKEMLAQKITEAVNENNEFSKAFLAAEDAASLQKVLQDNGMDVTAEELEAMYSDGVKDILKVKEASEAEELSEDQLDDVAGGGFVSGTARLAVSGAAGFAYGCACGVAPGLAAGAPYVAGGLAAWTASGYMKKGW